MSIYIDDDYMHEPSDHPMWQESWVLIFRDATSGISGFLRVGSYVNQGSSQVHWGLVCDDGLRFRRHRLNLPSKPTDRTREKVTAGAMSYSIPNGEYVRFEAHDPDCDVDLRLYDYYPSQTWKFEGAGLDNLAKHHLESSGRLEGHIRIGDRHFEILDGLGHRDHSWGPRVSASVLNNRWFCGTLGPALSFSCMTVQTPNGDITRSAFVVRDGVVENGVVDTLATVAADGVSVVAASAAITLESGERIRIESETIDCIVTSSHLPNGGPGSTPAGVEAMSIARWNGLEGFCDANININPLNGESAITNVLLADVNDGISYRDPVLADRAFQRQPTV